MKYVIYFDYRADYHGICNYYYMETDAEDILDAISIADRLYNEDEMYLVRIMERRTGTRCVDGVKSSDYKAIACKRSSQVGWHKNDEAHGEREQIVRHFTYNTDSWFETM